MTTTRSLQKPTRATALARATPETYWPPSPDGYIDDTAPEIRAYLARVRPKRDSDLGNEDEYHRGRGLIEPLAISTEGRDGPSLRLTAAQCADIVYFIRNSEPIEPETWFTEPDDEPNHHVGYDVVMEVIERCLRAQGGAS
jgi:hypothetical protein